MNMNRRLSRGQQLAILGRKKAIENNKAQNNKTASKLENVSIQSREGSLSTTGTLFLRDVEFPDNIFKKYLKMQNITEPFFASADSLLVDGKLLTEEILLSDKDFISNIIKDILTNVFEVGLEFDIEEMVIVDENFEPLVATATEERNEIVVLQNIVLNTDNILELTKKGNPRKRKQKVSSKENFEAKRQRIIKKYYLRPGCKELECKLKCISKINEGQRKVINGEFWKMDWIQQKSFILAQCSRETVKRRTTSDNSQRTMSVKYYLPNDRGENQLVCKSFFLTTLGYDKKNDGAVFRVLNQTSRQSILPTSDRRGRKPSSRKIERQTIVDHIESFHPCSSHYRREHAPLARYLPSDVSITFMHDDYLKKYPNKTSVSYDLYRKVLNELNIRFTKLGHEECESCEEFNQHNKAHTKDSLDETCDVCQKWVCHRENYTKARNYYQEHSQKAFSANEICVSIDLQKVIMIPRMESFKRVLFTKRLSVYHESFVPVGKKQRNLKPFATVWHEGITGRQKEDIISTYFAFFLYYRDIEHVICWADNCSAQNKNWCFLSFLIFIVNSDMVNTKRVEVNYFEPGHTFMSADNFHHQIEKSLNSQKKTYDFNDFVQAVSMANRRKVQVKEMKHSDFYKWIDHHSAQKLKCSNPRIYLSDIVQVVAEKGDTKLKYKTDFDGDFRELDFLKKKSINVITNLPNSLDREVGVDKRIKEDVINKLCPLMEKNRITFWKNLTEVI